MVPELQLEVFNECLRLGCCKWCSLRYAVSDFDGAVDDLESFLCFNNLNIDEINQKSSEKHCITCLDLLKTGFVQHCVDHDDLQEIEDYDITNFVLSSSLPNAILLRDKSMQVYLKEKFPNSFGKFEIYKISRVWRSFTQNEIAQRFDKVPYHNATLQISYIFKYLADNIELKKFNSFMTATVGTNSKNALVDTLSEISCDILKNYTYVPPKIPSSSILLNNIEVMSKPLFLIGKYRKHSRYLRQVTLIQNETIITTFSIKSIIVNAINKVLGHHHVNFRASAADDVANRVLGAGRSFELEICNLKSSVTNRKLHHIKQYVKGSRLLEINNLQIIHRKSIAAQLRAEGQCPTTYDVLCKVYGNKDIDEYLDKINKLARGDIKQKTPLRALNIRTVSCKYKKIHRMRAKTINGSRDLFLLQICVESGVHLKEFINGDLGRTKPSLGDLIGAKVDVIAADVVNLGARFF